ncbi:hypothetical protein [Marinobacterium sediminicola]|nr:hypothetical protein [Marinobacterium sediminicola]
METVAQFEHAREPGVDAVQEFLFRERFVEVWQPGVGDNDRLDGQPFIL